MPLPGLELAPLPPTSLGDLESHELADEGAAEGDQSDGGDDDDDGDDIRRQGDVVLRHHRLVHVVTTDDAIKKSALDGIDQYY